jgi:hypothetical protein
VNQHSLANRKGAGDAPISSQGQPDQNSLTEASHTENAEPEAPKGGCCEEVPDISYRKKRRKLCLASNMAVAVHRKAAHR